MVYEGYKVTIIIDPNEDTNNSPDIDGNAYFVHRTKDGGYIICDDDDNAPYKTDYSAISDTIKRTALASDDSGLLMLDEEIVRKLRGEEGTPADDNDSKADESAQTDRPAETKPADTTATKKQTTAAATTAETTAKTTAKSGTAASSSASTASSYIPRQTAAAPSTSAPVTAPAPAVTTAPESPRPTSTTSAAATTSQTTTKATTTETTTSVTTTASQTTTSATTTSQTTTSATTTTTETTAPEPETVTVTFKDENGKVIYQETVEVGSALSSFPAVPPKTGHSGEWKVGDVTIDQTFVYTEDTEVTAFYTADTFTVTFDFADGVTESVTRVAEYGMTFADIDIPDIPVKNGYSAQWQYAGAKLEESMEIAADLVIRAVYTPIEYEIKFVYENGEKAAETQKADFDSELTLPAVPNNPGYTGHWEYNGETVEGSVTVDGDMTITAVYEPIEYEITLVYDENTTEKHKAKYDSEFELPEITDKKIGYTGHWEYNGATVEGSVTVDGDMTITAVYEPIEYEITLVYDENTTEKHKAKYDSEFELPEITDNKTGYTGHWEYNGETVEGSVTVDGDMTITAVYEPIEYEITLVYDENTTEKHKAKYDSRFELPEITDNNPGYTGHWEYNGETVEGSVTVDGDMTITAVYEPIEYEITLVYDENTTEKHKAKYDSEFELPEITDKKIGYTGHWEYNGETVEGSVTVEGDMTITAVYEPIEYEITLVYDENTTEKHKAKYDSEFELPEVTDKKIGYTGHWEYNGAKVESSVTVDGDMTITAVYELEKYKVEFSYSVEDRNGKPVEINEEWVTGKFEELELEYGTQIGSFLSANTTKPVILGCEFKYWLYNGQKIEEDATVDVPENGVIKAQAVYEKTGYVVTYHYKNGNVEYGAYDFNSEYPQWSIRFNPKPSLTGIWAEEISYEDETYIDCWYDENSNQYDGDKEVGGDVDVYEAVAVKVYKVDSFNYSNLENYYVSPIYKKFTDTWSDNDLESLKSSLHGQNNAHYYALYNDGDDTESLLTADVYPIDSLTLDMLPNDRNTAFTIVYRRITITINGKTQVFNYIPESSISNYDKYFFKRVFEILGDPQTGHYLKLSSNDGSIVEWLNSTDPESIESIFWTLFDSEEDWTITEEDTKPESDTP